MRAAIVTALAVALPGAAAAWQVGNWVGRSVETETGAFAGCRMSAGYDSGITLHFLHLKKDALLIGMSEPGWSLTPGGTYRMALVIDGRAARRARGVVLAGMREALFLDLGRDRAIRAMLRRGQQLSLADGARTYDFRLTGATQALERLADCVRNGG